MGVKVREWKGAWWVFINHKGQRKAKRCASQKAAELARAGLRYRKPHTLRHTFASLLIEAGEPLTYVQQQLGHHSPAFTLAVYGHLLPRGDRRAVDTLDDATIRNPGATDRGAVEAPTNLFH